MRPKTILFAAGIFLLGIPWLLYASWLANYNALQALDPPLPQETVDRSDLTGMTCAQVAQQAAEPPAEPVDAADQTVIPDARAAAIADAVLREAFSLADGQNPEYVSGPVLLRAALPDGGARVVWARVWSVQPYARDQDTSVAYIDAETGDPLALYTGITMPDPAFDADCVFFPLDFTQLVTPEVMLISTLLWTVILIVLLLLVSFVIWGIGWLRRRGESDASE